MRIRRSQPTWTEYIHLHTASRCLLCHHHHCTAVVPRGWEKASACRLQVSLYCAVLCPIVYLQYLSRSSLHRLAGLPCRIFLSYGHHTVTREVHLVVFEAADVPFPGPFHLISHRCLYLCRVSSLHHPDAVLSVLVYNVEHTSFHFAPHVCSVLVLWVFMSLHYVKAGNIRSCAVFWQMAMLLLKIHRIMVLAYAAQPAMILRCIYLPWLLFVKLQCCVST